MPHLDSPEPSTVESGELQSLRERISELDEQVSQLKRLEDTIRRNNGMFEALLASSQDGITLTRGDGTIIRIVKSVLGYGPTVVSGLSIHDFIHPEDRPAMRDIYTQLIERHANRVSHTVRMRKADGSTVWLEGTATDMLDNPDVMAIVHNYHDITERKQAEITSLEFATLIEQIPVALFSKDMEGYIQSWNSGAERYYGFTCQEIIGQHISLLVPDGLQDEEEAFRATVTGSLTPIGPIRAIRLHKSGAQIAVDLTLSPMIRDGQVRGVIDLSQMAPV